MISPRQQKDDRCMCPRGQGDAWRAQPIYLHLNDWITLEANAMVSELLCMGKGNGIWNTGNPDRYELESWHARA